MATKTFRYCDICGALMDKLNGSRVVIHVFENTKGNPELKSYKDICENCNLEILNTVVKIKNR